MSSYSISPKLKSNRVFILQKSELEKRFDPQFYINRIKIKNSVKLSTLVKVKGGKRIQLGKYYSEIPTDFQYLRVSDMKKFGLINWDGLKYIPEDVYIFLERYKVEKGDVIISIAGTVGKTALIEKDFKNTILTENCAILEIRDKSKLLPKYLHILLELSTSKRQIELGFIQTTIPKLGFDKIEQLQLPAIPFLDKQIEIIGLYDKSFAQKQKNQAEAQKLLASIDDYLLKELEITLPTPPENTLKNRMFKITFNKVTGQRIDPNFHKQIYTDIINAIKKVPNQTLSKLIQFSNETWDQQSIFEDEFPYIEISEIDISTGLVNKIIETEKANSPSRAKMIVRFGDILVSTTRPSRGAISFYNQSTEISIASTGFAVLREVSKIKVLPEYLWFVLRNKICLIQMEQRSSGGNYPAIAQEELGNILIPVPPLSKQKEIANHITGIRQQAQQLKDKTKELLKKASEEIEKILLT